MSFVPYGNTNSPTIIDRATDMPPRQCWPPRTPSSLRPHSHPSRRQSAMQVVIVPKARRLRRWRRPTFATGVKVRNWVELQCFEFHLQRLIRQFVARWQVVLEEQLADAREFDQAASAQWRRAFDRLALRCELNRQRVGASMARCCSAKLRSDPTTASRAKSFHAIEIRACALEAMDHFATTLGQGALEPRRSSRGSRRRLDRPLAE